MCLCVTSLHSVKLTNWLYAKTQKIFNLLKPLPLTVKMLFAHLWLLALSLSPCVNSSCIMCLPGVHVLINNLVHCACSWDELHNCSCIVHECVTEL